MYKLSKKEYSKVSLLFENLKVDKLAVSKVIKGDYSGRIFADHKEKPTAALVLAGSYYFGGDARNADFNEQLKNLLTIEALPKLGGKPLFIFSTTDEWKDTICELLKDGDVIRIKRYSLNLTLRDSKSTRSGKDGFLKDMMLRRSIIRWSSTCQTTRSTTGDPLMLFCQADSALP